MSTFSRPIQGVQPSLISQLSRYGVIDEPCDPEDIAYVTPEMLEGESSWFLHTYPSGPRLQWPEPLGPWEPRVLGTPGPVYPGLSGPWVPLASVTPVLGDYSSWRTGGGGYSDLRDPESPNPGDPGSPEPWGPWEPRTLGTLGAPNPGDPGSPEPWGPLAVGSPDSLAPGDRITLGNILQYWVWSPVNSGTHSGYKLLTYLSLQLLQYRQATGL